MLQTLSMIWQIVMQSDIGSILMTNHGNFTDRKNYFLELPWKLAHLYNNMASTLAQQRNVLTSFETLSELFTPHQKFLNLKVME